MPSRTPALLSVLLAVAVGCGEADGGGQSVEAQPSPGVTVFQEGEFDGLPLPPLAEEAGPRSERDGVVTRSYFVRNRTPEDVLRFYEQQLDAAVVASPQAFGDAWRGTWSVEGRELLVSAIPAPAAESDGADVLTQLSLQLSAAPA